MRRLVLDEALRDALKARITPAHLRLRLGIESDYETRVFGRGRNLIHIENWYSVHGLIRHVLRALLLHARGRANTLRLHVRHNTLAVPRLPAAFDAFRILQISDLHLDMNATFPQVLGACVRDLDYDLCVLTGDFRYRTFGPYDAALEGMRRLRVNLKRPVYGILGNHDSIRMVPALEAMDIRMLLNESVRLERSGAELHLAGIDDPHYYQADNLEKASHAIPEDAASILLSHSPEIYRHAAHAGFGAMLCGHTHGGQIRLPGGIPITCNARCPRRLCAGPWRFQDMAGYTSVGAGSSIVDVRLNCPPEVTIHCLRPA